MIVFDFLPSREDPVVDNPQFSPTLPHTEPVLGLNMEPPRPRGLFFFGVKPVLSVIPAMSPIRNSTPWPKIEPVGEGGREDEGGVEVGGTEGGGVRGKEEVARRAGEGAGEAGGFSTKDGEKAGVA